jgi:hypothetical protein
VHDLLQVRRHHKHMCQVEWALYLYTTCTSILLVYYTVLAREVAVQDTQLESL